MASDISALTTLRRHAQALRDEHDLDPVLSFVAGARVVLLGEATHGTREFYLLRVLLTQRLIVEHGFDAVAVEADWPDALRASRWAQGGTEDRTVEEALGGFERFPQWMWRNVEVAAWLEWLREYNLMQREPQGIAGFFGLDLYSLRGSMQAVLHYLDRVDAEAARRARDRYSCFDHFGEDPQYYGHAVSFGLNAGCEREVVQQLLEMSSQSSTRLARADSSGSMNDEHFYAQQNARVVRDAEAYYRSMFQGRAESWNLRDRHMVQTLVELQAHLSAQRGRPAKIVVWAHNSHIGDARATAMCDEGEVNLGQLVRERAPELGESRLIGFTTHAGTVTAATDWDGAAELKTVLPSRSGSHERLLHDVGLPLFLLPLSGHPELQQALAQPRLERAIGVIYRPDTELYSHYFRSWLPGQFDAVVHVDQTRALPPLDRSAFWPHAHTPEPDTYPSGV
ncbi:MAG TPA: erythromycin esterase family protein [Burkholderiaceae bacterium]|nr:erythromycin esterase family protein [Burkholderiaceae bacterium]